MTTPLLGWIPPSQRTQAQHDAHEAAAKKYLKFSLPRTEIPKGTKIILTDAWKAPAVVADVGMEFDGFHQLTGSCVGASAGNAVFTLGAVQRLLSSGATKAFIPFWPFDYGRTRLAEGDHGPGEGAVDSVMGETLKHGVLDMSQPGLPQFTDSDGLTLTEQIEMKWSDGSRIDSGLVTVAKQFPVAGVAPLSSTDDIAQAIFNGYPVLDGCNNYIGHGTVKGSGDSAYVVGHYDGQGGHSTCFLGIWNHPTDGMLFLYSNQWPKSTYPKDPAGGGRCCVWSPESNTAKLFHTGGEQGETLLLSHLTYFPAQPDVPAVLDWGQV